MNKHRKNIVISGCLILLSIIYTILVKNVDVQNVGANNTPIGFATINTYVFNNIGVHMKIYDVTEVLGVISILTAVVFVFIGLMQLIKRKSLLKVDKEIFALGGYYVLVVLIYAFFEKVIINYRPILMDGELEASFPSSHTLISICLCGSAILLNKRLFNNKCIKYINILLGIVAVCTIVGRLVSGVHWFTDIIGGLIISSATLMVFYTILNEIKNKKSDMEK